MQIVTYGILLFIVLAVASFGGMFSERSGIVNIAINGMMIGGGLVYWLLSMKVDLSPWYSQVGAYLLVGMSGFITGGLFGFAAIKLKADHVIAGTAINMLLAGISLFLVSYYGTTKQLLPQEMAGASNLKTEFKSIFGVILFLGITLLLIGWVWISFTPWGMRLKASGENPQALDSQGINVIKTRYIGLMISSFLGSIAGAMFIQINGTFRGNVGGLGYVALAILIAGQWNPLIIVGASVAFGLLYSLGTNIAVYEKALSDIQPLVKTLPFVLALGTLVLTSKNSRAPKAAGVAYDKSKR